MSKRLHPLFGFVFISSALWRCPFLNQPVPPSVSAYLAAHGGASLLNGGAYPANLGPLVAFFREAAPAEGADPFSGEAALWLEAVADCRATLDEQLYEHFRAMGDLFRERMLKAGPASAEKSPLGSRLVEKGLALGLLPPDRFGSHRSRPHLGV